jgi:putative acetyltransferase
MTITVRALALSDAEAAAEIFHDAVQTGAAEAYTQAQRDAWSGPAPDPEKWRARFEEQTGVVAEAGGEAVGFMTLDADGHVDLAYVRPERARQGVGGRLYAALEALAREAGLARLSTHASLVARPFFEKQGWRTEQEQQVSLRGETLTNFAMSKRL